MEEKFQSSPSIQRETATFAYTQLHLFYFNPLPLYRGRREVGRDGRGDIVISILSLYTEGDSSGSRTRPAAWNFNPLPLYRGRRELFSALALSEDFNPLPLYRGRLVFPSLSPWSRQFQSSPSIQRETQPAARSEPSMAFQSSPSIQRETAKLHNILHLSCHIYVQLC